MTEVPVTYPYPTIKDHPREEWEDRALCAQADPEAFFPTPGGSTNAAKRICEACEVRAECLAYALAHNEHIGIWGGLSERERRKLKAAPAPQSSIYE